MLHSGIDLHKRDLVIHTVAPAGVVVKTDKMPTTRAAVTAYFRALGREQRAVVESTASWYWLADLLRAQGIALLGEPVARRSRMKSTVSRVPLMTGLPFMTSGSVVIRSSQCINPPEHSVSPAGICVLALRTESFTLRLPGARFGFRFRSSYKLTGAAGRPVGS
jgi:hypothetical protein